MRLDTEFYKLPLRYDAERLAHEVREFAESDWRPHPQGYKGNTCLLLLSVEGDLTNDEMKGPMRPTPLLKRSPYIQQVMASLGTNIGRSRLMRIDPESRANPHVDTSYYWAERIRVHIPVITWPEVRFICNEKSTHMAPGEAWIFDNTRMHDVINPAKEHRVHLVVDTTGSPEFWEMVRKSEKPFAAQKDEHLLEPRFIPFDPSVEATFAFEDVNFPVVMAPEEQQRLWKLFLESLGEVHDRSKELIVRLEKTMENFFTQWRTAWERCGDQKVGWGEYRKLLNGLDAQLMPFESQIQMYGRMQGAEILRQSFIRPALNPEMAPGPDGVVKTPPPKGPSGPPMMPPERRKILLERPVIVVSAPRSGSSWLFETLSGSPSLWTIGGESHGVFERFPKLNPAQRGFDSNRLTAQDAAPALIDALRFSFVVQLRDRNGHPMMPETRAIRMLEKTPKNALRIPFLSQVFPDALFVYLYREPHENISSIIEAWRSKRFVTYPELPGWQGDPWSLLLIPEWRELIGKDLGRIAAAQWEAANRIILEDLEQLPAERLCALTYEELTADTGREIGRLCDFAGISWDRPLDGEKKLSSHTLTPPDPNKWKKNAALIEPHLPGLQPLMERAKAFIKKTRETPAKSGPAPLSKLLPVILSGSPEGPGAGAPNKYLALVPRGVGQGRVGGDKRGPGGKRGMGKRGAFVGGRKGGGQVPTALGPGPGPIASPYAAKQGFQGSTGALMAPGGKPLQSSHTNNFPRILERLGISLVVSTYQAGKVVIVRAKDGKLNTHYLNFERPMGMVANRQRMAIGARTGVWIFRNQPEIGRRPDPEGNTPGFDAVFLPTVFHMTGDIMVHEMCWGAGGELWIANTRFNILCTLDPNHSFMPRWRPPFITELVSEDRCHLNGIAMFNGQPRYVSALGETNVAGTWRENKASGGVILDVATGQTVMKGLAMPHSPRLYNNDLYVLESGQGSLARVDLKTKQVQTVAELPGFTRGISFAGRLAFIGLSQIRETATFGELPITERITERTCGVWVVDIEKGQTVAFLRFESGVEEIFAVEVLPETRFPNLVLNDDNLISNSFTVPPAGGGEAGPGRMAQRQMVGSGPGPGLGLGGGQGMIKRGGARPTGPGFISQGE